MAENEADTVDVIVAPEGYLFLVTPQTDQAREWLDENLAGATSRPGGDAVLVEGRYLEDLVLGMREAGSKVEGRRP
jgi:hypothetical protein